MFNALALSALLFTPVPSTHTFSAGPDSWLMDGKPYLVRSGEMHYARIPRAYWADRLKRAKAMGLNTICTYVFWNFHETEPGKFDFKGDHDVAEYIREAQRQGLNVILRPGPYVCAEWEWGGFPYWLANIPGMQIRQNNPEFLKATARWLDRLGKELAPLTVAHGGPIILCQVENEYGSFGSDHVYMESIHQQLLHAGFDCQMYTADGSGRSMLEGGTLPDLPSAINFGGGAPGEFANLSDFRKAGPRMNGEYWCGWFDHWGDNHNTGNLQGEVKDLEWMLSRGDSVNLYMAHGGTTFGTMQGANSGGSSHYEPDTTSYDYDAPIAEDGTLSKKFWAFRDVFKKHLNPGETVPEPPSENPHITIPRISFDEYANLADQLPKPIGSSDPLSFEELHHPYGIVMYSTKVPELKNAKVKVVGLQDRAWISDFMLDRASGTTEMTLSEGRPGVSGDLMVTVESLGRVNFSRALLKERKGILGLNINGVPLHGWNNYPIDLDHLDRLKYTPVPKAFAGEWMRQTLVQRGTFSLDKIGDTYLQIGSASASANSLATGSVDDGFVWVNGHNLGRWNNQGPQQALYCPACYLSKGRNEIYVLHMHGTPADDAVGLDHVVFSSRRH